jgi:hypothetical protein
MRAEIVAWLRVWWRIILGVIKGDDMSLVVLYLWRWCSVDGIM